MTLFGPKTTPLEKLLTMVRPHHSLCHDVPEEPLLWRPNLFLPEIDCEYTSTLY